MTNIDAAKELRTSIEQAIARGWPVVRIMTEFGVTYEHYRAVRDELDALERGAHACDKCRATFVNLARHITESHSRKGSQS